MDSRDLLFTVMETEEFKTKILVGSVSVRGLASASKITL